MPGDRVDVRGVCQSVDAGILAAALDYIEGWYEGSGERMERALHPELAKRTSTRTRTAATASASRVR